MCLKKLDVVTNSVDPDEMPHSVVSDLGLQCLFTPVFPNTSGEHITKTCLYNFDLLKPHFCIVKLGFTGVYIIFLIFGQNINCGYSLEPPRRGGSNEYQQPMF